jgi:hypothetical protein
MDLNENIFILFDLLDLEAERLEFESILPANHSKERDFPFADEGLEHWEYTDDETDTMFRGWVMARLSDIHNNKDHKHKLDCGGLLTESVDSEEFHALACSWKDGQGVFWSDLINHIDNFAYGEVEAWAKFTHRVSPAEYRQQPATVQIDSRPTVENVRAAIEAHNRTGSGGGEEK